MNTKKKKKKESTWIKLTDAQSFTIEWVKKLFIVIITCIHWCSSQFFVLSSNDRGNATSIRFASRCVNVDCSFATKLTEVIHFFTGFFFIFSVVWNYVFLLRTGIALWVQLMNVFIIELNLSLDTSAKKKKQKSKKIWSRFALFDEY